MKANLAQALDDLKSAERGEREHDPFRANLIRNRFEVLEAEIERLQKELDGEIALRLVKETIARNRKLARADRKKAALDKAVAARIAADAWWTRECGLYNATRWRHRPWRARTEQAA